MLFPELLFFSSMLLPVPERAKSILFSILLLLFHISGPTAFVHWFLFRPYLHTHLSIVWKFTFIGLERDATAHFLYLFLLLSLWRMRRGTSEPAAATEHRDGRNDDHYGRSLRGYYGCWRCPSPLGFYLHLQRRVLQDCGCYRPQDGGSSHILAHSSLCWHAKLDLCPFFFL